MESIIEIKDLSVAYNLGKTNESWVLQNINANIYPGEYVIFFGPSGCGKSTLLYTIAGLEFPTTGDVMVDGNSLRKMNEQNLIAFHRTTIGMIFQAFYLIPSFNVRDNVLLPQIFSEKENEKRADIIMERFGISHLKDRKPSFLSGGQQQRVAIARALVSDPPIILADEPVGNLDSKNAGIVLSLLDELNRKDKKTIIHVTHDMQALKRADKVFFLKDGKLVRRTLNPKKQVMGKEKEMTELEKLAQAYPYLSETSLRAKLILNHILSPVGVETQQKIESIIDSYLLDKINKEVLFESLNKAEEQGGAALYSQRAQSLTDRIVKIAEEIKIIEEEPSSSLTPTAERAIFLRGYLLDNYKGNLSFEQIQKLEDVLSQRIENKIGKERFIKFLDAPLHHKGVGLNKRTAKRFAREIELILMK